MYMKIGRVQINQSPKRLHRKLGTPRESDGKGGGASDVVDWVSSIQQQKPNQTGISRFNIKNFQSA